MAKPEWMKEGQKVVVMSALNTHGVIKEVDDKAEYATVKDNFGDTVRYPWELLAEMA